MVETTNVAAGAFVQLGIRRAQYESQCTVVVEEASIFRHHTLLCAGIRSVVDEKHRRCSWREIGGGLPKQHDISQGILAFLHDESGENRGRAHGHPGWEVLSHVGEISSEGGISAPIERKSAGITGSELFLLDERSELSARRRASYPVTLTGGCGVTTGSTDCVGSACSTDTVEARRGCTWTRKDEREHADTPDVRDRRRGLLPCAHA